MGGRRRGPERVTAAVDFGEAELVRDPDRAAGWTLLLDGTPQSYVELSQPTWLEFEYVRQLGAVVDLLAPARAPLQVLHLGGGGLTLPRYIAAIRPGSVQRVVERDAALTALVRRVLPPPRGADLRVRTGDAREVVESARADRYHLVINDVYSGARMPGRLTTTEFFGEVSRVLRPGGWYAANLADRRPLTFARSQAATLRAVFRQVCLMAEPGTLKGRRFGNLVLVATDHGKLPVDQLARRIAAEAFPARLLHGEDLDRFIAGAHPITDLTAADSPEPPGSIFATR